MESLLKGVDVYGAWRRRQMSHTGCSDAAFLSNVSAFVFFLFIHQWFEFIIGTAFSALKYKVKKILFKYKPV